MGLTLAMMRRWGVVVLGPTNLASGSLLGDGVEVLVEVPLLWHG